VSRICPCCSDYRYAQLVAICPLCGAPGKLNEVEDIAVEYLRELEHENIRDGCEVCGGEENRRLEVSGHWKSLRGRSLESFGFVEV